MLSRINALQDRGKISVLGGFDRTIYENLDEGIQHKLAWLSRCILISSLAVFISISMFVYIYVNTLIFSIIFGFIASGVNWFFFAVVFNASIPPWLQPAEAELFNNSKKRIITVRLLAVMWSLVIANCFALSGVSIYCAEQIKEAISSHYTTIQFQRSASLTEQSMFELGMEKPGLVQVIDFVFSPYGVMLFLMLLSLSMLFILTPLIYRFLFSTEINQYRIMQHKYIRGLIVAGYEESKERLEITLAPYNLVPEHYVSVWTDEPFNTKQRLVESIVLSEEELFFEILNEGEAKKQSEAQGNQEPKHDAAGQTVKNNEV